MSGMRAGLHRRTRYDCGEKYRDSLRSEHGIVGGRGLSGPHDRNHGHRETASGRGVSDFVEKWRVCILIRLILGILSVNTLLEFCRYGQHHVHQYEAVTMPSSFQHGSPRSRPRRSWTEIPSCLLACSLCSQGDAQMQSDSGLQDRK